MLDTAFELWSHQRPVEGKNQRIASLDLLVVLPTTAQKAAGHCCKGVVGSCSTCCPPGPQSVFYQAAFQPVGPQLYWCAVLFLPRSRTLLFLLSFMWFPLTPCSSEVSLNDSKTLCSSFEKHESFSAASWGPGGCQTGDIKDPQHWQGAVNTHLLPCLGTANELMNFALAGKLLWEYNKAFSQSLHLGISVCCDLNCNWPKALKVIKS